MNIFVLDKKWHLIAQSHHDRHVVKMILETAQLLCTAQHLYETEVELGFLYKKTHENHPCARWVRRNISNYEWTFHLFEALLEEYTYRFNKKHKSGELLEYLKYIPMSMPNEPLTSFEQVMPDIYKKPGDAVGAYRAYYIAEKVEGNKWTNRARPDWVLAS